MDRRTRALVVIGVALVFAGAAAFGVVRVLRQIPRQTEPVREVVVAKGNLAKGSYLAKENLQTEIWPVTRIQKELAEDVGFSRVDDTQLIGRRVEEALEDKAPVLNKHLDPLAYGGYLQYEVEPGYRAMSVRVNEVVNVAGFVVAGTRVDVVVAERPGTDSAAKVVLANVLVLSAGTATEQQTEVSRRAEIALDSKNAQKYAEKPLVSTVVTLMVTPAEAERLALAQSSGTITLTLRHPSDRDAPATTGETVTGLFGRRVVNGGRVEAIRGTTRSQETVIR